MSEGKPMHARPQPLGGRLMTPGYKVLLGFTLLGALLIVWRFATGLGATTNLSDGYPWGLWIVLDVVTGTALACGGYAVAILVYLLNRGRYHPLIRPAILTSALGYTLAMVAVGIDVGRPWIAWKIPFVFWYWNLNSVLLEVALCILAYVIVLWIELSPALMEKWAESGPPRLRKFSIATLPLFEKALPVIAAIGIILPTMHQSSLGSLMLLSGPRLNGLWFSSLVPLFFLITAVAMGHAMVIFEVVFAAKSFGTLLEMPILKPLQKIAALDVLLFVILRFADLGVRGRLGLAFQLNFRSGMFWLETALFLAPFVMVLTLPPSTKNLLRGAIILALAGTLYRFDTFLVAFDPGPGWHYFPSVIELLITVGLVCAELAAYIAIVRVFPILAGAAKTGPAGERSIPSGGMNPAPAH